MNIEKQKERFYLLYPQEFKYMNYFKERELTLSKPLQLKSLDNISDEDCEELKIYLMNVIDLNSFIQTPSVTLVREIIDNYRKVDLLGRLPSNFVDKLRSLNYVFPYDNLKIEDLLEKGWVELIK